MSPRPTTTHSTARMRMSGRRRIADELASLRTDKMWTVVQRRGDMHVIGSKWVFKVKRNVDGEIQRYKARM